MEVAQIAQLLSETLSPNSNVVRAASEALERLSVWPDFPFSLLSIAAGGENQGQKVAAATYLKNFTRRSINDDGTLSSKVSKEFKDQLMRALLQVEPAVLKVLVEAFRVIVAAEFVKQDSWPELVPDLRSAIQNSNLISNNADCQWKTINALTVLHALLRPFQYFLNPKVAKESVSPQLELIAKEVLVPLLSLFHHLVEKALATHDRTEMEMEKILLTVCKCIYFAVRSHMPSTLAPVLPSLCRDLIAILGSLSFDCAVNMEDGYLVRLKTGKRSLLIFCAFISRHRKHSDKLMPDIINCVLNILKYSRNISELDFLSDRVVSLAFDVISHIMETGPGWRLVSPHFTFLLDTAIFPALVMNEKDSAEWEEDADEYIRKNLPSDLEEISGWREDLFTARKSAINLLGVISMSKGPPVGTSSSGSSASSKRKKGEKDKRYGQRRFMGELFVLPFLSKFPIPSDANASQTRILNDYYGVLMAYGGLQDFLREQEPGYITSLVCTRVLPLYKMSVCLPYLVASANWVLGELAPCLPEEMSADVYSSLLKALAMPDKEDTSCYPVRVSAAGAIAKLLENDYAPPEWLPLLEVVIGRISNRDEESSILCQLLSSIVEAGDENVAFHIPYIVSSLVGAISKLIPANPEPWSQVVEQGFAALAVMAQSWENFMPEELEQNELSEKWASGRATVGRAFSALLQQAWLSPVHQLEGEASPPPSCIEDASTLLLSVMLSVTGSNVLLELKVSELLLVWADLIADWHAWEETEDLSVFNCIKEVVNLHSKYGLENFLVRRMPSPPAPPVPERSIIEGIGVFVSEAILQYPSATWRACSMVHLLLHVPSYSSETDGVKQSLAIAFSRGAFSRFREIRSKPCSLWKPLLLAISSCYLCYPHVVEGILEKGEGGGCAIWASALGFLLTSSCQYGLSATSEIKLIVMALSLVVERLLGLGNSSGGLLHDCFISLLEASVRLKEVLEEKEGDEDDGEAENDDNDDDDDDDEIEDYDEESEPEEHEETEEEFLDRYAKAAAALENGTVIEEGDEEDQDHETELGALEEVDQRRVVLSLIEKYHHVLIQGQALSLQVISRFLNAYPECSLYFQQSR
ncbi:importin beta-like SAD2 homolog isoform X2 [Alnus glutinosa]|uniref:importin beta-like SAD2 homolog isoform X2 n=1 Tax=Alnus glutinosa TaxID=3517 RepID=UPI002D77E5EF|nr:importin beta-like SAD2 homolog isoform X2 [Alnus glutinosa]